MSEYTTRNGINYREDGYKFCDRCGRVPIINDKCVFCDTPADMADREVAQTVMEHCFTARREPMRGFFDGRPEEFNAMLAARIIAILRPSINIAERVHVWVVTRLGVKAMEPHERAMRMLEEALELAQAMGVTEEEAERLRANVFQKPAGEVAQELGGAAITLFACAESVGQSLLDCGKKEMDRVESLPVDRFRRRQEQNVQEGIGAPAIPAA